MEKRELLAILLMLSILLLGLFSRDISYSGQAVKETGVEVERLFCGHEGKEFVVCADITRRSGDALKVFVTGGVGVSNADMREEKEFQHCEYVGTWEGKRVLNVLMYDAEKKSSEKHYGYPVLCKGGAGQEISDYMSFRAKQTYGRNDGAGEEALKVEDYDSCVIEGRFFVDDDQTGRQRGLCHGATGNFFSYFDRNGLQYGSTDQDSFAWNGYGKGNFLMSDSYQGAIFFMRLCDPFFSQSGDQPRSFVRAVVDPEENILTWEYRNVAPPFPQVDVMMNIECSKIPESSAPVKKAASPLQPTQPEETPEAPEVSQGGLPELEIPGDLSKAEPFSQPIAPTRLDKKNSVWMKLFGWMQGIFF